MANTKVTQHVIADDAITTSMITDGNVTVAKLPSTVDLSSKTLTLPAVAIPSASTATTQSQSDGSTKVATTAYVDTAVSNLIDSAPGTMNTLNEIAAALNDDANFNTTVTNSIAAKLPLAGGTMTGDIAHASNFTIDAGGNIDLDADGSHIIFSDGGTEFGRISHESTNLALYSLQGNGDIKFAGVPSGGSSFYALTLNMSASGFATFNSGGSFGGTGALKIPVGTTGQRPTAATGQIRFNSTDGKLEVYTGSAWSAVGSGGVGNHNLDTFTGDGSTTAFTLTVTPSDEDSLTVFIDGAYQEKGDYSLSGTTLTLDTAPLSGEKVSVHTITGTIHDGTAALNQQFTGDGSTTAFTLNAAPGSENNTQVFINGVYQQKTDYTVSGTTLTFDTAPTNGDIIEVNSFTVTNLGNSDQVTEGSSNLYHTSARAISAISAGNLTGLTVDTNVLSVDATNDRVGIGTASPSQRLHVDGGSALIKSSYDASGTTNAYQYFSTRGGGTWRNSTVGNTGSNLVFGTGGTGTTHSNATERMRIQADGKVGIGTTAIPHGGIGTALLALEGADQSWNLGPHIQLTTAADDYPILQVLGYGHDNVSLNFDSYFDGTSWKSSDAGSNFQIYKLSDYLQFRYAMNTSAGSEPTWGTGLSIFRDGQVFMNSGIGGNYRVYGVRAWARFNGNTTSGSFTEGTNAGNMSSYTRTASGNFSLTMTYAMPDTNYIVAGLAGGSGLIRGDNAGIASSTTVVKIETTNGNGSLFYNTTEIGIMVVR